MFRGIVVCESVCNEILCHYVVKVLIVKVCAFRVGVTV